MSLLIVFESKLFYMYMFVNENSHRINFNVFCTFIDLKQALDTIKRGELWQKHFISINGEWITFIRNI